LGEEVEEDGDDEDEDEEGVDGQLQDPVAAGPQVQLDIVVCMYVCLRYGSYEIYVQGTISTCT